MSTEPQIITITSYEEAKETYRQKDLRQALYDAGVIGVRCARAPRACVCATCVAVAREFPSRWLRDSSDRASARAHLSAHHGRAGDG